MSASVYLKPGKDKPLRGHHPWLFSGAIARIAGPATDGDLVNVLDADGHFLARGYLNRRSQIAIRLLTWNDEAIDAGFWQRRLDAALSHRAALPELNHTNACRLIFAESDGFPGLIVDRYDQWLVLQCLTLGMERHKEEMAHLLAERLSPRGIYERSDADVREKEGLKAEIGQLWGEMPPDRVEIEENGCRFLVDLKRGQKTGFYLDQRENRRRVAAYATGREALNVFAYTGGFGVALGRAGAPHVVQLDSSGESLALAAANMALNGLTEKHEGIEGDAFLLLRQMRAAGRQFDLIVLDPPRFAASQSQLPGAMRGYKDINLLALHLLRPGGLLATFSCTGLLTPAQFQMVVWEASVDAGRPLRLVERLAQGGDHPVLLSFPESEYLKGLIGVG